MGKIEIGEGAELPQCGDIVCSGGVFLVDKESEEVTPAVHLNERLPLPARLVPTHALEARRGPDVRAPVVDVLLSGRRPQVRPLVVQPVVVDVIDTLAAHDQVVHVDHAPLTMRSRSGRPSVRTVNSAPGGNLLMDAPPVLHHKVIVLVINECDSSSSFWPMQGYSFHVGLPNQIGRARGGVSRRRAFRT